MKRSNAAAVTGLILLISVGVASGEPTLQELASRLRTVQPLTSFFEGRGNAKAAHTVFVGNSEIGAPLHTIDSWDYLNSKGAIIQGAWLETEHTALSPGDVRDFVALSEARGYPVIIRIRENSRSRLKEWLGVGPTGVLVPLVSYPDDVNTAFDYSFYAARRDIGFEPHTGYLTRALPRDLLAQDQKTILGFMIETEDAVNNIESLVTVAGTRADQLGIPRSHIVFWWGPYDKTWDATRQMARPLQIQGPLTLGRWEHLYETADSQKETDFAKVARTVHDFRFTMGGHVNNLRLAQSRIEDHHCRVFTIPGIQTTVTTGPSLREMFLSAEAKPHLDWLQQQPTFTPDENKELVSIMERLGGLCGYSVQKQNPTVVSSQTHDSRP